MRILTEKEAITLTCPFDSGKLCLGSSCMAWMPYTPNKIMDVIRSGISFKGDQGFCDFNGRANPIILGTVGNPNANK